ELQSLQEIYTSNEKLFNGAIKTLFARTLKSWHDESRMMDEERELDDSYREQLGIGASGIGKVLFESKIESLVSRLPMIGIRFEFNDGGVTVNINGRVFSYPDPLKSVYGHFDFPRPVPMIITPGTLSAGTVFVAGTDGPWLTDFLRAGPAPLASNHVALEAAIRFD